MKKLLLLFGFTLCLNGVYAQGVFTAATSGNWNTAGTWTLNSGMDTDGIPDADDDVTIGSTFSVTVNAGSLACNNLTISSSTATLTTANRSLTINGIFVNNGTLSITGNGIITVTLAFTNNVGANINVGATGALELKQTTTNDGTITINGTLSLTGGNNRTLSGTGSATIASLTTLNNSNKTFSSGTWTITLLTTGATANENVTFGGTGNYTITTLNHTSTVGTVTIGSTGTHTLTNVNVTGGSTCILTVSKTPFTITASENWNISNGSASFVELTNNSSNFTIGASGTVTSSNILANNGNITATGILSLTGSADRTIGGTGTATIASLTTANSGNKTFSAGTWTITSFTTGGSGNLIFDGLNLSVTTLTHNGTGNITFKNNASVFNVGTLLHNGTGSSKMVFNDANYTLSLTNFTMNTASTITSEVFKDIVVSGTLTLTNGKLTLGSTTNFKVAAVSGGSASSYVIPDPAAANTGSHLTIVSVGTSPVLFPVGTSANYAPVSVNYTSGASDTWARVSSNFTTNPTDATKAVGLEWNVNKVNGGTAAFPGTLTMQWVGTNQGNGFSSGSAKVYHLESSVWVEKTSSAVSVGEPYTITGTGLNSFSPYAVFSAGALPVELVNFAATEENGNARLTWQTLSERNNRGFDIEKSLDAKYFYKIGTKEGAGTSEQTRVYSFIDDELSDVSYYRLKQVDMDGGFTYSKIAVVVPEGASDELMVSPNPSNDMLKISIKGTIQQVNLLNLNGQTVLSNSSKTIDIANLPDGMYLLQVITENGIKTKKVVKQL